MGVESFEAVTEVGGEEVEEADDVLEEVPEYELEVGEEENFDHGEVVHKNVEAVGLH